jgi:hypothetical protein
MNRGNWMRFFGSTAYFLTNRVRKPAMNTAQELVCASHLPISFLTHLIFIVLGIDFRTQPLLFHPKGYFYSELSIGDLAEFILVIWPPCSHSQEHDHQGHLNFLIPILGQLEVYHYQCCSGRLNIVNSRQIYFGHNSITWPFQIHEVVNSSENNWATSLHIYLPKRLA